LAAAVVLAASTVGIEAQAQDPFLNGGGVAPAIAEQELLGAAPTAGLMVDPAVTPAQAIYGGLDEGYETNSVPSTRPVNWISGPYLRGGVNFVIGEDIFDVSQETGYGITGGIRQALGPELGGDRFFFDVGGSFQDSYGEATPISVDGRRTTTLNIPNVQPIVSVTTDPNAFLVTLEELRRASAHAALGWYWGSPMDNRSADPQVRVATRIGGRVGHVRGGYHNALVIAPPVPPANTTIEIDPFYYKKTDTYGGVFIATEAILLNRQTSYGLFQWTVDGEFANDWINIGEIWKGSLGTASVMMGFTLSR
jgi:hypothetical protein